MIASDAKPLNPEFPKNENVSKLKKPIRQPKKSINDKVKIRVPDTTRAFRKPTCFSKLIAI